MRVSVAGQRRMMKRKLQVEFARQALTSYSGLELRQRYLRQRHLPRRLHKSEIVRIAQSFRDQPPSHQR